MPSRLLNVDVVESLQRAAERGRSLSILTEFSAATLAGLLEYGCLRYAFPDRFPLVPGVIAETQLAFFLQEAASPLGLRSGGPPKPTSKDINTRGIEFQSLPTLDSMASDVDWECFLTRFDRSAREAGFSARESAKLLSALAEMCENALLHSESPVTPLVGYMAGAGSAQFSVVDVGIGVRASLSRNPIHQDLEDDVAAIQRSLRPGVTSRTDGRGGLGFQSVFKALAEQWGELRFRSGNGCIAMSGSEADTDHCVRSFPPPLHGFQVSVCCRGQRRGFTRPCFLRGPAAPLAGRASTAIISVRSMR